MTASSTVITRGDVWLADLDPRLGHEQSGKRPVLVVSDEFLNVGRSGLVVILPITSTIRTLPLHVELDPPEGGLKVRSAILCDAIRSIDRRRLMARWGAIDPATLAVVEDRLRILLRL
ncbi:MAG: type II toxin-antitoxin system PemK/MazF family toxin [Planctomycetia bacterium]